MPLLGKAAIAMWWNVMPERRAEFGDWHSHEHFPERMSIPGFSRGSRWTSTRDATGFFVLYELKEYETLSSSFYLDRLNNPTPWSSKMMPHHLNMVRSQCRVAASFGGGIAGALATIRLAPRAGAEAQLRAELIEAIGALPDVPGLAGAHLLVTDTPTTGGPTTEQRIRGADATADWIVLISGYDPDVVQETVSGRFSPSKLQAAGARQETTTGQYRLAFAITPRDIGRAS
jgi:hypothetical protein